MHRFICRKKIRAQQQQQQQQQQPKPLSPEKLVGKLKTVSPPILFPRVFDEEAKVENDIHVFDFDPVNFIPLTYCENKYVISFTR